MNRHAVRALPLSTLVALALSAPLAFGARIDPGSSHAGFTLTTRWGQVLQGRFPDARGDIAELPDLAPFLPELDSVDDYTTSGSTA